MKVGFLFNCKSYCSVIRLVYMDKRIALVWLIDGSYGFRWLELTQFFVICLWVCFLFYLMVLLTYPRITYVANGDKYMLNKKKD